MLRYLGGNMNENCLFQMDSISLNVYHFESCHFKNINFMHAIMRSIRTNNSNKTQTHTCENTNKYDNGNKMGGMGINKE